MTHFRATIYVVVLLLLCQTAFGQVRISEILVTNTSGLLDQDGTPQPWVEIWNTNRTTAQSLQSWRLTDGVSQWVFPAVSLPPNDRLVVFMSGKNRSVVSAPLHTSFALNPSGGLLRLHDAGGTLVSSITYPAQSANVSYGSDSVQPALTGFYQTPTPGRPNNYSGFGVAGKVLFSVESRAFTGVLSVQLALATPVQGAQIRYTQDGSAPLSTSTLYTGNPIQVSSTQQIRARVFEENKLPGEIEAECYLLLDPSTQNFNSGMPLIVLTNFSAGTPVDGNGTPPDNQAYMWVWEPNPAASNRARFSDTPTLHARVGIDRRGSSTLGNPKFNLNLETRVDWGEEEKDVVLLGMPAHSDWVFHAPYFYDRTLIHNPFIYGLSNAIGRYAPRTRNAEVFIDVNGGALTYTGAQSGDYFGVYNIMEKIRRGSDRVDIAKLDMYDNDAVKRTGGYIVKVDRRDTGDSGFTTARQSSFAYYYPKEVDLVSNQRDAQEQYIKGFMQAFDNACYAANWRDPVTGYRRYLDVDAAIDHHLLNTWAFNVDALRLSGYLHVDRGGKIVYGPIWDFDRALCSADGRDANPMMWRSNSGDLGTDFFNYTWWNRLFQDPDFYQAYIDRWTELRRGAFSRQNVEALVDRENDSITPEAISRDLQRWNQVKRTGTNNFPPYMSYPATQAGEIRRMKDWLQARADFMTSQWVSPVTINLPSGRVTPGTTVSMSAPKGTIYYTLDGSDPRPEGGALPSGGNVFVYSGPITVEETVTIRARAYDAAHQALTGANNPPAISRWSGRTDARFSVDPAAAAGVLAITEINYHPTAPTSAELTINPRFTAAAFEFIELKNVGNTRIDLANAAFTMGITFTFSGENAISLEPGEHVIVSANPAAFAARYGSRGRVVGPFSGDLSNAGERLVLNAEDGEVILDFTYDDGWYPNTDGGGATLVLYDQTSPGSVYGLAQSWRSSVESGGSPGADEPPFVTTLAATQVGPTSVLLNAEISANGIETAAEFVIGEDRYPVELIPAGSGATSISRVVTGLSPHTPYTFRVEATNSVGSRVGTELSFVTLNRAPQLEDKVLHLPTRDSSLITLIGDETDPDDDEVTIVSVTQPQNGTVEIMGDAVVFTPGPGATGNDSFTYTVADDFGGETTATVTFVNQEPIAHGDVIVCNGEVVTFDPKTNDLDEDGDPLVIEVVTNGLYGTAAITPEGQITYTPTPGYFGRDTFSYTITDGIVSVSAVVEVRNSSTLFLAGISTGDLVPGQAGFKYATIDPPGTGGVTSGVIKKGKTQKRAIFSADGNVLLKVGDDAPGIVGAKIAKLGAVSGQSVLATLKGGVTAANNVALLSGLSRGSIEVIARTGMALPNGLKIKKIFSFDGEGRAVFLRVRLAGAGVNKKNDDALLGWSPGTGLRELAREQGLADGKTIATLKTLFSSAGTTAEGRWRTGEDSIGVQTTFINGRQALFSIPIQAESANDWERWAAEGDELANVGVLGAIEVPGFSPDGVALQARLSSGGGVNILTGSEQAVVWLGSGESALVAQKGSFAVDSAGAPLSGSFFATFKDPIAGADGRTAFIATLTGSGVAKATKTGIWRWEPENGLRLVARSGDLAPGGGIWDSFTSLVLPNGPESGPIFTAKLKVKTAGVTAKNNQGLWAVDSEGQLGLLVRTGHPLVVNGVNRTVKNFVALKPGADSLGAASGYDDAQRVTAYVTFTDGTRSLVNIAIP